LDKTKFDNKAKQNSIRRTG